MKYCMLITTILLTTTAHQLTLTMEKENNKQPSCLSWITTLYTTKNDNQPKDQTILLSNIQQQPTTTKQYIPLVMKSIAQLKHEQNYGNLRNLIAIINSAKTEHTIEPYSLGKAIFMQSQKNTNHAIAAIIVAQIGQYLESIPTINQHPFTLIETVKSESTKTDSAMTIALLDILDLKPKNLPADHQTKLGIQVGLLLQHFTDASDIIPAAQVLYNNKEILETVSS